MKTLADQLALPPPLRWFQASVASVQTGTLTINYRGGNVPNVAYLDHYTPTAGDIVNVLSWEPMGMLVLGREVPHPPPTPPTPPTPTLITPNAAGTVDKGGTTWGTGVPELQNLVRNPEPSGTVGSDSPYWNSNDPAKWGNGIQGVTDGKGWIGVNRLAAADADVAASLYTLGLGPPNPVLEAGRTYWRSVEIWVDAQATLIGYGDWGFGLPGQTIPANTWHRVTEQFTGSGAAQYATAIEIRIPGVGTGTHAWLRRAMLVASDTDPGYFDGNTPDTAEFAYDWTGTTHDSASTRQPVDSGGPGTVVQDATHDGAFFYDPTELATMLMPLASVELRVHGTPDSQSVLSAYLTPTPGPSGPLELVGAPFLRYARFDESGEFWLPLPVEFGAALTGGAAAGVAFSSNMYVASVTDGTLRITPL